MEFPRRKLQFIVVFLAVFSLLMTGFAFARIEEKIQKSFKVNEGGKLTLKTDIGSIEVKSARKNTLEVEVIQEVRTTSRRRAKRILDDFEIDFDHYRNDVNIKAEYKRGGWSRFWNSISNRLRVKFLISVPRIYNVELSTKGGSITIDDLEGEVNSRTSGGILHFNHIKGDVWGRTSGGSVRVGRVDGNVDVHTSGGSIKIGSVKGEVNAHTSGGSITVEEVMGTIKAKTSGRSVKAYISKQPKSSCSLSTSGGSVTVHLADGIGMYVNARTSGGRVRTEFPVTIRGELSKRSLKAEINGGGPELYLRTSGGNIYLKKY